jgi:hypothetical protein
MAIHANVGGVTVTVVAWGPPGSAAVQREAEEHAGEFWNIDTNDWVALEDLPPGPPPPPLTKDD